MRSLLIFLVTFCTVVLQAQDRCSFDVILHQQWEEDPELIEQWWDMEEQLINRTKRAILQQRSTYTIPVVVHILWNTEEENIALERVQEQLDILNRDFSGANPDLALVPDLFKTLIADVGIQFCLADRDPDGMENNGVTRTRTFVDSLSIADVYYSSGEGHDAWDPERYLNIWVANLSNDQVGFGSYPSQNAAAEDGVVIDYRAFGKSDHPRLDGGRTLTHEVGHYFGLFHPWGNKLFNADCREDDGIPDTPLQSRTYAFSCPDQELGTPESCGTPDMYMNFMNYTNDACLHMFTIGQRLRMLATLLQFRYGLLESEGCSMVPMPETPVLGLKVGPNPAQDVIYLSTYLPQPSDARVTLYDLTGRCVYDHNTGTPVSHYFSHFINVADLTSGLYLLVVEVGEVEQHFKLIIQ